MNKVKVSEASVLVLDWLVAKCEGLDLRVSGSIVEVPNLFEFDADGLKLEPWAEYRPCSDWAQGGPILERENICIRGIEGGFHARYHQRPPKTFGPTMLIAAMRCFVTYKLGGEVEVHEELL